jgi:Arylsulfotransferase (ASST)
MASHGKYRRALGAGLLAPLTLLTLTLTLLASTSCSDEVTMPADTGTTDQVVPDGPAGDASPPDAGVDAADDAVAPVQCVDHPGWTVGLVACRPGAAPGYTLFAPLDSTVTYLIDRQGRLVHSWLGSARPGMSAFLLPSGLLLRPSKALAVPHFNAPGAGGQIQTLGWDGAVAWSYLYANAAHRQHHDVEPLPSGNVLLVAWERKSAAAAIAAGRDPSLLTDGELWVDHLVEVQPSGKTGGTIVWEWHLWDHLIQDRDVTKANYGVVAGHPELLDINVANSGKADWTHVNAVAYNPQLDQIVLTVHGTHEIFVIDHSTSSAQAASHTGGKAGKGGDILYRWGNPQTYRAGTGAEKVLFGPHDGRWIPSGLPGAGDLLVFNNGVNRKMPIKHSTVDQLTPPLLSGGAYALTPGAAFGPPALAWQYKAPSPHDLFSSNLSGAQRLPGGNTLVCAGDDGELSEVTSAGNLVWKYISPITASGPLTQGDLAKVNAVFRATRYLPSYAGLAGRDLTPKAPIELPGP